MFSNKPEIDYVIHVITFVFKFFVKVWDKYGERYFTIVWELNQKIDVLSRKKEMKYESKRNVKYEKIVS